MAKSKRYTPRPHRNPPKQKKTALDKLKGTLAPFLDLPREKKIGVIGAGAAGIVLAVLLILFLIPRPIALTQTDEGDFYDAENGITYRLAPLNYEPETWLVKRAYARGEGMDFYEIKGLSPDIWLCTVDEGLASVWCALENDLPGIEGFGVDEIIVCTESTTVMALKTVEKRAHAEAVVKAFTEGESIGLAPEADRVLRLKFTSNTYRGLFYNLTYLECEDNNYLYDAESKKCVPIGGMLLWYINREDMDYDSSTLIGEDAESEGQSQAGETDAPAASETVRE